MAANAGETKVKLWEGICYPENMRDDWQDEMREATEVARASKALSRNHVAPTNSRPRGQSR